MPLRRPVPKRKSRGSDGGGPPILLHAPLDGRMVTHRIAIAAAVDATVIGADVARFGAQAAGPVAPGLGGERPPAGSGRDIGQARGIDAARAGSAGSCAQIRL